MAKHKFGYNWGAQGLKPKPATPKDFPVLKSGTCPEITCGESRAINIIDLGRGLRQCRTCGEVYIVSEGLRRAEVNLELCEVLA